MFAKILVANRGEIACRVIRALKEMGIKSVAVYSEADAASLHVRLADEAVLLGPAEPALSYLDAGKIIAAAKETGAEAIHPGYGFLSENADFADACQQAGIVFIGPPGSAIRALGRKTAGRRLMMQNNVPVIPGMERPSADIGLLQKEAARIGYPVLVKAAAGGGGKGMRVVASERELPEAATAAGAEAKAAFGDGGIYLEKYLARPRHVEVQVLCDRHGNAIHLLERECSIQRRHQKIIEETPSPALTPELREKMGKAAVAAALSASYVNAGTVEFLLDSDGSFYFLEVNTRLQVEHPITELVTGVDLVRRQVEVAAGLPLDLRQEDIRGRGHAIECRICGEDPENNFFPSPGKVLFVKEPAGPFIRNDSGIFTGAVVPVEYDPLLGKLIVWAEDRERAISRMRRALADYAVLGITTIIPFLSDVLGSEAFRKGDTHTRFIEEHFGDWKQAAPEQDLTALLAYAADSLFPRAAKPAAGGGEGPAFPSPWQSLGGFRL
ncbi:MAG: acetyl-CoA carboxylase biotin carboxylase subunit [Thermodesulfobacteriota bacterium]